MKLPERKNTEELEFTFGEEYLSAKLSLLWRRLKIVSIRTMSWSLLQMDWGGLHIST